MCNSHYWTWRQRFAPSPSTLKRRQQAAEHAAARRHAEQIDVLAEVSASLYLVATCRFCDSPCLNVFCSDKCRIETARAAQREWNRINRPPTIIDPVKRECQECGDAFWTRLPQAQYCSPEHGKRAARRRRARRLGKWKRSERQYRRIMDRDAWTCQLCTEPIDPNEKYPSSWQGTLDHIVPRSKGGSDHDTNIQAAHLFCNGVKSDHDYEDIAHLLIA
jgi:5-methylcytosine-specific restriction endonuclease McrA